MTHRRECTDATTYRGGCRCGAIRCEIAAEPMFAGQCQCRVCQHETGGGHAGFVAFPADAVSFAKMPTMPGDAEQPAG